MILGGYLYRVGPYVFVIVCIDKKKNVKSNLV